MIRRFAGVAVLVVGSSAVAQTPPPSPAAVCRQVGNTYQTQAIQAERQANRSPDPLAILPEAKRRTRICAETLSTTRGSVAELTALSALWLYVGDTARAEKIVADLAARPGLAQADRADVLLGQIQLANAAMDPFAGINEQAEAALRRLDAMSDSVIEKKITGHTSMLGRYQYADIDAGIEHHGRALLDLARHALATKALPDLPARPAQGNRPGIPTVNRAYLVMMTAYDALARAAGDYLHADSALMILDEADRLIGPHYPPAKETFERRRAMYRLVGTKATPIDGKWWVSAADGRVMQPGNGKITVLQFTATWCVPCKKSYPPMLRLMDKYKGKPVESIMSTELYGYLGSKRNLTPEQEVAANREYYAVEHKMPFPVAINAPGASTNDARYAVGGIPEIVIIDRKGIIRATVVGWDKGNEARFAAFIDKLLAEK